jgi:transposase
VEERMRFVWRLKDGESMSSLCREFGISRVTGYKVYERYKECGLEGLTDRARTARLVLIPEGTAMGVAIVR